MWVAFAFAKATHIFFSKNNYESDIVLTRAVNILTTNKLVKLTTLWTTGPRIPHFVKSYGLIKAPGKGLFYQLKMVDIFLLLHENMLW